MTKTKEELHDPRSNPYFQIMQENKQLLNQNPDLEVLKPCKNRGKENVRHLNNWLYQKLYSD